MPAPARKNRPRNARDTRFQRGNPGRPKGIVNERARVGQEAASALEAQAWDVVERLLASPSWKARHEAAKTVLGYSIGLPKQTLDIGGLSDVAALLTEALRAARDARVRALASAPASAVLEARVEPEVPALAGGTEGAS